MNCPRPNLNLRQRFTRGRSAFTLIELLVVILIIAILIAVALPSFLGETDKAHVSAIEQQEYTAYEAAKAATVNGATNTFDTGTTLVADITKAEPELAGVLSASTSTSATAGDGKIYVGDTTASDFEAVGVTASDTTVELTASASGGVTYSTSTAGASGSSPAAPSVTPDILSIIAGTGASGAPTPGLATSSSLDEPIGVAVDASGNVYIGDSDNNEVEKVTPSGTLSIIAGTGTSGPATPGPATSSDLSHPAGIAVDASGNVYICDSNNNEVEKVTPSGTLSIIAGTGTAGAPTPGPATSSKLDDPSGVAVDSSGNLYIADEDNDEVEKVTPSGTLSIIAGTGTVGTPTPGPATSSEIGHPYSVAVDSSGNVYIDDQSSYEVLKVTPSGTLSIIAGDGSQGAPTPGPAGSSELSSARGVAVDANGNVYIADPNDDDVLKVTPSGTLSIVAGTGTAGAPTPGPATSSELDHPFSVAVDAAGNVYIADQDDNEVEKVTAP